MAATHVFVGGALHSLSAGMTTKTSHIGPSSSPTLQQLSVTRHTWFPRTDAYALRHTRRHLRFRFSLSLALPSKCTRSWSIGSPPVRAAELVVVPEQTRSRAEKLKRQNPDDIVPEAFARHYPGAHSNDAYCEAINRCVSLAVSGPRRG